MLYVCGTVNSSQHFAFLFCTLESSQRCIRNQLWHEWLYNINRRPFHVIAAMSAREQMYACACVWHGYPKKKQFSTFATWWLDCSTALAQSEPKWTKKTEKTEYRLIIFCLVNGFETYSIEIVKTKTNFYILSETQKCADTHRKLGKKMKWNRELNRVTCWWQWRIQTMKMKHEIAYDRACICCFFFSNSVRLPARTSNTYFTKPDDTVDSSKRVLLLHQAIAFTIALRNTVSVLNIIFKHIRVQTLSVYIQWGCETGLMNR